MYLQRTLIRILLLTQMTLNLHRLLMHYLNMLIQLRLVIERFTAIFVFTGELFDIFVSVQMP